MGRTIRINGNTFRVVSSMPASPSFPSLKNAKGGKAHRIIPRPLDGNPVSRGTLTLTLAPPSVNSLFHNRKKGRGKTLAYRNWRSIADHNLRQQPSWHVPGKVRITIRVGGSRADVDNLCKAPLDALVTAGRIQDDKDLLEVRAIHDNTVKGARIEIEAAR